MITDAAVSTERGELHTSRMVRPEYAERFSCIGPACEDSCCRNWAIFFDEATCGKYEGVPAGPLRALIDVHVVREEPRPGRDAKLHFARVALDAEKNCPLLNPEGWCRVQAELGAEYLSVTCATYPRIKHVIDGAGEMALSLSCPEAARLVLPTPDLLVMQEGLRYEFRWRDGGPGHGGPGHGGLLGYFWAIREFVLGLLTNRKYALWQRVFLVGIFCRRLEAFGRGEAAGSFADFRRDFAAAVESGMLRGSLEGISADLGLQLDLVLRMAGLPLPRSFVVQRFLDVAEEFKRGIGYGPGATMEGLIAGYGKAYTHWYRPFFEERPHILENMLVNTVFRMVFPFGNRAGGVVEEPAMGRELALLVAHFALMKGLLIGVAGARAAAFCEEDVVRTVQAASKHFEHHPQFLDEAYALVVRMRLDTMWGLVMLVR